jgi:hypothetical protein
MTHLDYALAYAENGLAVFPTHWIENGVCSCRSADCGSPGKHPIYSGGFKNATIDPAVITEWWTRHPIANIGIATGSVSGIFVIDVDVSGEKVGLASLEALEAQIGPIPCDMSVRTGSGGLHIYLKQPDQDVRNSTSQLGKHIDVRGSGGYVIAPPSTHISGNSYEWIQNHDS